MDSGENVGILGASWRRDHWHPQSPVLQICDTSGDTR